jgi:hypothetical protein
VTGSFDIPKGNDPLKNQKPLTAKIAKGFAKIAMKASSCFRALNARVLRDLSGRSS